MFVCLFVYFKGGVGLTVVCVYGREVYIVRATAFVNKIGVQSLKVEWERDSPQPM